MDVAFCRELINVYSEKDRPDPRGLILFKGYLCLIKKFIIQVYFLVFCCGQGQKYSIYQPIHWILKVTNKILAIESSL